MFYSGNVRIKPKPKKKKDTRIDQLEIPVKNIDYIARSLEKKFYSEQREKRYAKVKEVLTILAGGTILAASFVAPGLSLGLKDFIEKEEYPDANKWKIFNPTFLARTIKRLERQRLVEIINRGKYQIIKITDRGRKRVLKYAIDEIELKKPKIWDGKWYFVTYDIPKGRDWLRDLMRDFLTRLGFYRFHESLYIHAYPCLDEIDFLREYLGVSEFVKVLVVNKIENDKIFRDYFGI